MKGKSKLNVLYEYQLNIYLTVDSVIKLSQKNEQSRPYLSSRHLRNRSPHVKMSNLDVTYVIRWPKSMASMEKDVILPFYAILGHKPTPVVLWAKLIDTPIPHVSIIYICDESICTGV